MSNRAIATSVLGCALGAAIACFSLGCDPGGGSSPEPAASTRPVGERVKEILDGDEPMRRVEQLSALLPTLGPDALPELVEALDASPIDGGEPEVHLLAMWWADFDPEAAYQWTSTEWRARYDTVIAAVFRSWAREDPEQALAMAMVHRVPTQRDAALDAAISGWDESGRPGLLEAIVQLPDQDRQRLAGAYARSRVAKIGPAEAFRWVDSLEIAPQLKEMFATRIASESADTAEGGPLAAEWATPRVRSDDRLSHYPRRIATRWVLHDPEPAMAWLASLPAGRDRQDGVSEAFRTWLARDPQAAIAWIETTDLQAWNEPALAVYTRAIVGQRPEEAMEMVQRITDPEIRSSATVVVGRTWMRNDREAAEAWFAKSDVPEDVRRRAAMVGDDAREQRRALAERRAKRAASAATMTGTMTEAE